MSVLGKAGAVGIGEDVMVVSGCWEKTVEVVKIMARVRWNRFKIACFNSSGFAAKDVRKFTPFGSNLKVRKRKPQRSLSTHRESAKE